MATYVMRGGKLVLKSEAKPLRRQIMPDIPAYESTITGEMIEGRAAHREHLRRHGYVEVDGMKPTGATVDYDRTDYAASLTDDINRAFAEHGDG